MDIKYHIEVDEEADGRGKDFLASFIHSKSTALSLLREYRKRNPAAYLVKCVRTRCPEPQLKKEQ